MRIACAVLLGLMLAAAAPRAVAAQTLTARGGVDLTSVSFDSPDSDVSAKVGFVAGVAAAFPFAGPLRLQVEGLIAQKRISFVDGLLEDRLTFVDVPVLVTYGVHKSASGRTVHVFGGGVVSVRLAATEQAPGESIDIKDAVKKTNASVVFGGDYQITRRVVVDVRYAIGLSGAYNAFNGGAIGKLRTLQISAGYRFR